MADREWLMTLATEIIPAHVSNNAVPLDQLSSVIQQVFSMLATVEQKTADLRKAGPSSSNQAAGQDRPHRLPGLRQAVLDDQAPTDAQITN